MPKGALQPLAYSLGDGPKRPIAVTVHPARVLAECDPKRRIVREHVTKLFGDGTFCPTCTDTERRLPVRYCATLRLLALPYADHPVYRAEWRP
jgi:hypothetical protein